MRKRPTIREVARRARVSIATVSFVLNDHPHEAISERVKQRVWKAARALDYHASAAAAGLARQRTRNVAIIFYQAEHLISNQFYSFVVQGAVKQAMDRDYNLLFSYLNRPYSGYADLPRVVQEKNVEGVLFIQTVDPRMVRAIQARGVPVVAIDYHPAMPRLNSLEIDNETGGATAGRHLVELGHRRLGVLYASAERPSIQQRIFGFQGAVDEFSGACRSHLFQARALTFDGGFEQTLKILKRKQRPTALFCANDELAAGALRASHQLGLRVPDDLSVVGFDDITMSNYTNPPLTTLGVVKEQLGRRAMTRLLELVENADSRVKREILPVRLVVRASTTTPPG